MNLSTAENGSVSLLMEFLERNIANYWPMYTINLILSLPINGCVLWLIITGSRERMASEYFALNLAMSEVLYCIFNVLYIFAKFLNTDICFTIFKLSSGHIFTSRLLFQCCICIQQYLGVVHPIVFLRYKPLRYKVACCSVVWVLVLGSCLYIYFGFHLPGFFHVYFVQYLLLLSVQLFCCLSVLRALKQPGPGAGTREKERTHDVKRRAFNIILTVFVFSALTCLGFAITVNLGNVLPLESFSVALSISPLLGNGAGFIQPLLYLHRARKLPCIKH